MYKYLAVIGDICSLEATDWQSIPSISGYVFEANDDDEARGIVVAFLNDFVGFNTEIKFLGRVNVGIQVQKIANPRNDAPTDAILSSERRREIGFETLQEIGPLMIRQLQPFDQRERTKRLAAIRRTKSRAKAKEMEAKPLPSVGDEVYIPTKSEEGVVGGLAIVASISERTSASGRSRAHYVTVFGIEDFHKWENHLDRMQDELRQEHRRKRAFQTRKT